MKTYFAKTNDIEGIKYSIITSRNCNCGESSAVVLDNIEVEIIFCDSCYNETVSPKQLNERHIIRLDAENHYKGLYMARFEDAFENVFEVLINTIESKKDELSKRFRR